MGKTIMAASGETTRAWLSSLVARHLNLSGEELDPDIPLTRYGVDSLAIVAIISELADALGQEVSEAVLFEYPTINMLAEYLDKYPDEKRVMG